MSKQTNKGTSFESLLRDSANAFAANVGAKLKLYRPANAGYKDEGDLHGASPYIVQAKAYKDTTTALRVGVDGAVLQATHAGEDYGVAVIKRARKSVGDAYAVMRYADYVRVLIRLRRAESLLERTDPFGYQVHIDQVDDELNEPFPRGKAQA